MVPAPYPTIQSAIDNANDLDTVLVQPGTYTENINIGGKNITLTSIDPEDLNVVESTIIDGNHADTVVTFSGSAGGSTATAHPRLFDFA